MVVRARLSELCDFDTPGFTVGGINRKSKKFDENKELFEQLYLLGYTYREIMNALGVESVKTIQLWRNKLRLLPREMGNHSRRRRKKRSK